MNQMDLLIGVSRTFALTIPQLPEKLRNAVATAYLLCRIVDTIEDEPGLSAQEKVVFLSRFELVINGIEPADIFAADLFDCLTIATQNTEKKLVSQSMNVLQNMMALQESQRTALIVCVTGMARGMASFQVKNNRPGLDSKDELERYCYYVAGIVGEMLTTVFCDYSAKMSLHRDELMVLSRAFGQGLQMTNILKDIWEDLQNNVCWLPRDVFLAAGYDLDHLVCDSTSSEFDAGLHVLIEQTCSYLSDAMHYAQLIPVTEPGMRNFCYQSIGMAALTLRNIYFSPGYQSGNRVKISRRSVRTVIWLSQFAASSNTIMNGLFKIAIRNLPNPKNN